jgi:AcrR family transcriptional regulator
MTLSSKNQKNDKSLRRIQISDVRRNELTSAALRCISAKGYDRVTLDDVAKESGFSQGIVLYYFKNRDALLVSTVESIWADLLGLTRTVYQIPEGVTDEKKIYRLIRQHYSDPQVDFVSVIRDSIRLLLSWFEEHPDLLTVVLELFCQIPRNTLIANLRDMTQPFIRNVSAVFIEEGVKRGAFKSRNPQHAAHMLLSAITGLAFAHVTTRKGEFDLKKLEADLCDIIFGYLLP